EIRKRIAQYYHEPGHESEIRIELPSGSYVPEFQWPSPQLIVETRSEIAPPKKRPIFQYAIAAIGVAALLAAMLWIAQPTRQTALDHFWQPVLGSSNSVLLCLGIAPGAQTNADSVTFTVADAHQSKSHMIGLGDAITLSRVASLLGAKGKSF